MDHESVISGRTDLGTIALAYGHEMRLEKQHYGEDFALLRVTIREGRRFTQFDLDYGMAAKLAETLTRFAEEAPSV